MADAVVTFDRAEVVRWLDYAYPVSAERAERLHVGRVGPGGRWSGDSLVWALVADVIVRKDAGGPLGVYLGACTYKPEAGNARRAVDTAYLYGMWSDLDVAGPGHKHDPAKHDGLVLPPDEDAARTIVATSGLPEPSAWVASGGGFYAWWMLDNPVPAAEYGGLAQRWQAILATAAARHGWHYGTAVSDLARVLRVPGTVNRKVPGDPRPCRILSMDGPRYTIAELLTACPEPAPAPQPPPEPPPVAAGSPTGRSPIDDFNDRAEWPGILESHGWTYVETDSDGHTVYWRHPNATNTKSASTGHTDADTLKCFSDSAGLPTEGTLSKAFVWAALRQRARVPDMRLAGRELAQLGYGQAPPDVGFDYTPPDPPPSPNGTQTLPETPVTETTTPTNDGRKLRVVRASEIRPRATRWLWETTTTEDPFPPPGRGKAYWLPLGGLCLLGGREGTGKTTWAYRIVAQVTRGTLPGALYGQPASAIIATTEDDWEPTVVPRLIAEGADLDQVMRVDVVEGDHVSGLTLPSDIPELTKLCQAESVALIILDPLMGTLSTALDSHKDAEVRRALEPLSRLAHAARLTIIGLIHVNKSQGNDLLTRLMASRAFSAVARTVLFAAVEEPEPGAAPAREAFLLGQPKNNLQAKVPYAIRYHLEGVKIGHDDELGVDIWSSHVVVDGTMESRIEDLVSAQETRRPERETRRDRACKWLRELLANGPIASAVVKEFAGKAGFSPATIKRASQDLEIIVTTVAGSNSTAWELPSTTTEVEPVEPVELVELLEPVELLVQNGSNQGPAAQPAQPAPAHGLPRAEPNPEPTPAEHCCGQRPPGIAGEPLVPACQLCSKSPNYWKGD